MDRPRTTLAAHGVGAATRADTPVNLRRLNNPLSVVAAQATLLAEEAEGTPLAARAEKVGLAARRCGRIVASLLASVRRRPPRREAVDLRRAIATAMDLMGMRLQATGVEVRLELPKRLPRPFADPDQVVHLLANLLGNAGTALAPRPPPRRVAISARRERGMLALRVADNGPGIPPELREKVFDAFFTTRPTGSGSGIGLALCRTIAQDHGGRIEAEETPGGGATLVLRLPLAGAGRPRDDGGPRPPAQGEAQPRRGLP